MKILNTFLKLDKEWLIRNFNSLKYLCIFLFLSLTALVVWEIIYLMRRKASNVTFVTQTDSIALPHQPLIEEKKEADDISFEENKLEQESHRQLPGEKVPSEASGSYDDVGKPEDIIKPVEIKETCEDTQVDPWQKLIKESVSKKKKSIKLEDDKSAEEVSDT